MKILDSPGQIGELLSAMSRQGIYPKTIGSLHSYNEAALSPYSFKLGKTYDYVYLCPETGMARIGGAATIESVMLNLRDGGRRVLNSGNFRKQTFVGAALTGTHGYGKSASMIDQVLGFKGFLIGADSEPEYIEAEGSHGIEHMIVVTEVLIKTAPLTAHMIEHCACKLSDLNLDMGKDRAMSFQILPYSGKDPAVLINFVKPIPFNVLSGRPAKFFKFTLPFKWQIIRSYWFLDSAVPALRSLLQKIIGMARLEPWKVIASKFDLDFLYHEEKGLDFDGSNEMRSKISLKLWAMKPTFRSHNVAFAVKPKDFKEIIKFIIALEAAVYPGVFECFIGCRYLSDSSDSNLALNHGGPMIVIDLYSSPKRANELHAMQKEVAELFDVRLHRGKTPKATMIANNM